MDCSSIMRNYSRYFLIIFNLLFAFTGVIIIAVGLSTKTYYHDFDILLDNKFFYVSDLLIIIGVIIFFIAFFGCCGAIKENACMTTTFSTLLIVIFILEVVAAVSGILLKRNTEDFLVKTLTNTIKRYESNHTDIEELWDKIQTEYKCCGINNVTDWTKVTNSTNGQIPLSCCKIPPGTTDSFTCTIEKTYPQGCLQKFGDYIRSHTSMIEGVGIGLAVIQLLGILLSCYLAKSIRSDYETV